MTELRVGVIGVGAIGAWHARILAEGAKARLVALCDLDYEKVGALSESLGAKAYTEPTDLFAEGKLDGVIIATPEHAHLEHLQLAAEHGVAALVEKPVAADVSTIQSMIEIARNAGIMVMAGHVERFEVGSAQLKAALDEGVCGSVVSVMARRQFAPVEAPRFAGISSTLKVLGVHDFDLLRWVHPAPIIDVYAVAGRGPLYEQFGLDDHVVTTVRFAGGAIGTVESAWNLPPAYTDFAKPSVWSGAGNNRLDVFGREGFISNDMSMRSQQLIAFDQIEGFRPAGLRHQTVIHGRVEGALRIEVDHFVDCLAADKTPIVGLEDGLRAVSLMVAAEEALATEKPVTPEL
ncbi:MAG: Gfo/Idh/MocA family oxidoreductase [Pseudomonadota bacterium]